jgi:hypothetical protein
VTEIRIRIADDRTADEANADARGGVRKDLVAWTVGRLGVRVARGFGRGRPGIQRQLRQNGEVRAARLASRRRERRRSRPSVGGTVADQATVRDSGAIVRSSFCALRIGDIQHYARYTPYLGAATG